MKRGSAVFMIIWRNIEHQTLHYTALVTAEKEYSTQPPYKWLGKYFHVVLQKL